MKSKADLTPPRLYTRRGDTGLTDCPGRGRVGKDDALIEALGTLDELNAHLGLLAAELAGQPEWAADVRRCQHELMALGATWVVPRAGTTPQLADGVAWLESRIDSLTAALPPLRHFVVPGGSVAAAQTHVCRTVCRRLERACVRAGHKVAEQGGAEAAAEALAASVPWLNRLSDYLFAAARTL